MVLANPSEFHALGLVHAKVDQKFSAIAAAHAKHVHCRRGCHSCCLPNLTVSAIEAAQITAFVRADPELLAAVLASAAANPHAGTRCQLLSAQGDCLVYPVRPALCRSHGVPAWAPAEAAQPAKWDVCPLNFVGIDVTQLPDARIGMPLVSQLLFVVGEQWRPQSSRVRVRLRVAELGLGRRNSSN